MKKALRTLYLDYMAAQHLYFMWECICNKEYENAMTWQLLFLADREMQRAYIFSMNSAEFYRYMDCSAIAVEGQP
jgi:hypothetical protein